MERTRFASFVSLAVLLAVTTTIALGQSRRDFTEVPFAPAVNTDFLIVQFQDPPAASYTGGIPGLARTKPLQGRFDPSSPAAQAYLKHLDNVHANYRSWLAQNAAGAQVVREYRVTFNGLAMKLNGVSAAKAAGGPGVQASAFSSLYRPTMDVSPGLVNAPALWTKLGGVGNAGQGVKVGVIDAGIDITNPFLSDAGFPPAAQTDACSPFTKPGGSNTSNKVIVCRVFTSGIAPGAAGALTLLVSEHGTHVSGTIAGRNGTSGTVQGTSVVLHNLSGIAPKALLGDYNVFPGFGGGFVAFGGSAFSHDIAAALEAAFFDGMDVVNMSLGGGVQGPHDFLADAVNSAVDAGMVVAVAAGNSGPGDATIESPGSAAGALTAGASTNPHFIGIPATLSTGPTFGAAIGDFNPFTPAVLNAAFALASPSNGCTAITGVSGKIALIDRGVCSFTTKVRNAQTAGALGVLMINNVAGDPVAMGQDGTTPVPTISAVMVSLADRAALVAASATATISVDGSTPQEFVTGNADIIAGFSSRGPTPFTFLIKPDATAPGVNVASSVFNQEFAFFQGTSMATPHLAGAAALLHQFRPTWSPDQIKSALANTAKRPVTRASTGTGDAGIMARGGGRIDLDAASNTPLTIVPSSASFGLWTGNRTVSSSLDLSIANVSAGAQSCTVAVSGPTIVTASTSALSLGAGATTTLTLQLSAGTANQTGSGDFTGDVTITCGSTALKVPWWTRINRLAK